MPPPLGEVIGIGGIEVAVTLRDVHAVDLARILAPHHRKPVARGPERNGENAVSPVVACPASAKNHA